MSRERGCRRRHLSTNILGTVCVLLLSGPEFPDVELKFLAFEDVAIGATALAGSARDASVETTSRELGLER